MFFVDLPTQKRAKKVLINLPPKTAISVFLSILFTGVLFFPEVSPALDQEQSLVYNSIPQDNSEIFPYLLAENTLRQNPKRLKRRKSLGHLRIGHTVHWSNMTRAQRSAFQHSYSRHGAELGLPVWKQRKAAALQKQFNTVVGHIRKTGTYLGIKRKPVNGKSTSVKYFESTLQGTKYFYYETLGGKFVSAGKTKLR